MNKFEVIFLAAIVFVSSAQLKEDAQARVLKYEFTNDGCGNYKFSYGVSNGLIREETGEVVNAGQEDEQIVVRGLYSYIDANGSIHNISYAIDKDGFHQFLSATLPDPEIEASLPPEVVGSMLG